MEFQFGLLKDTKSFYLDGFFQENIHFYLHTNGWMFHIEYGSTLGRENNMQSMVNKCIKRKTG